MPTKVNDPGSFFAVAAYQVFSSDGEFMRYKYDVASALNTRIITYQDPAEILTVTKGMRIGVAILIALSVAVLSYVLFQTFKYRQARAMQLSQAPFLIVFLVSAINATLCSFLFNPKSDIYCLLRDPLVLIPLQLVYSIVVGRLWRISVVISPLLTTVIENDKDKKKRWSSIVCRAFFDGLTKVSELGSNITCKKDVKRHSLSKGPLRSMVTNMQLAKVVVFFTIPQILIQILSVTLQPCKLTTVYNNDLSVGHVECSTQSVNAASLSMWGWYLLLLFFVLILFLAYESRTLPSLFNETQEIYNSILISIIVMAVGLATIRLSDSPTTSPDVAYLLKVLIVLTMTLNVSLRTMVPKIQLAKSGKAILINKLVTDHRLSSRSSFESSGGISSFGAGRSSSQFSASICENGSSRFFNSQVSGVSKVSETIEASGGVSKESESREFDDVENGLTGKADRTAPEAADVDCKVSSSEQEVVPNDTDGLHVRFTDEEGAVSHTTNKSTLERKHLFQSTRRQKFIHIDDKHAPARALILKMMEAQKALSGINQEINSGYVISHEAWINLREACVELGDVFSDKVKFAWEEDEKQDKKDGEGKQPAVPAGAVRD